MSALTPHLKVLRTEAEALLVQAAAAADKCPPATYHLLNAMAAAKTATADALEAEQREREEALRP